MKPLVLTLRARPEQRLDLSPLTPDRLAGKGAAEIAQIELQTTRTRATVGDLFHIRMGDGAHIRIENACDRLDRIGESMTGGEIVVAGSVGIQAGRLMSGGRLGGPLAGETTGMRGGIVVVRRNAGARAGDRMRRGTIIIEGAAGAYAGSRMIAGSVLIRRRSGPLPGYLMRRGTILLAEGAEALSPTFVDCGTHTLLALRLMAEFIAAYSAPLAAPLRRPLRRFAGDMAATGKGEVFVRPE
jgi:formylmethanofuran dehydrogenase subunit C